MNEEDAIELSKDELSTLKDLIRMYKLGKKTAVQAIVTALVGMLFTALTYGVIHWIRTVVVGAGVVLVLLLVGCGYYQSQTTVFGVEVEYNPSSSITPTARAGVITHRQNYARTVDMLHRMENSVDYYDVSLFTTTGTFHGRMIIEPPPKTANPPPPTVSWWNPFSWYDPAVNPPAPASDQAEKPAGEIAK